MHSRLLVWGAGKLEVRTEFQPGVAAGAAEAQHDGPVAEQDEFPFVRVEPHGFVEVVAAGTVVTGAQPFQLGEVERRGPSSSRGPPAPTSSPPPARPRPPRSSPGAARSRPGRAACAPWTSCGSSDRIGTRAAAYSCSARRQFCRASAANASPACAQDTPSRSSAASEMLSASAAKCSVASTSSGIPLASENGRSCTRQMLLSVARYCRTSATNRRSGSSTSVSSS